MRERELIQLAKFEQYKKKTVKKAVIPGYGKKGSGWIKDPKKAAYNKVYKKTTFSFWDLFK
ncbi:MULTISPECIES: hypothetical protein [Enterococcus]|uniref:hypothetical protein n=1 Tax=Enterococcus TaxID=1350 RepID=UPI000C27F35B|nr:hypothetical protein [Enterococcus faecium]EGP4756435.1 hypothetical protein [Enterococcus faecium]PJO84512.1 hypothetical protein CWI29_07430 [Enterococcus faecium]RXA60689.1 hypothetical protein EQ862_07730 [Enterococcus faecium]RXA85196.1 hypothetical protein EQ865_02285 [Enterococcus faecium]TBV29550.1 hypothetical protein E0E56_08660 [Enterococcus faecium]